MYRLKSSWRDFSGWMRMQIYPEPNCSCCWELQVRPERHLCTSMPVKVNVDMVVLPREKASDRVPGDQLAENIREWRRDEKWRGEIFVPGPDSDCWRDWAALAGAKLIPLQALGENGFPPEGRLQAVGELSEYHVVMPEVFATRATPDTLDFFTPNGLPLLFLANAVPIPQSALAFQADGLLDYYEKSGLEAPAGYSPYLGPYAQCKSDIPEMEVFYSNFVAGLDIDSENYGYLSMFWRYATARGVA